MLNPSAPPGAALGHQGHLGHHSPRRGRPVGQVNASVAQVLASGVVAGVDALAQQTGWPPASVRDALRALLSGGRIGAVGSAERPARAARRGRPRVAYAWRPAKHGGLGVNALALQQVCAAWGGLALHGGSDLETR